MLEIFNERFISLLTPFLLLATGLFFSFKLRFFYLRHPLKLIKSMTEREKRGEISPFRAVTLALAGTLGVGNIAGVASSIAIGGYGSIFWMWVSAFVAMVLKYAEIVLAMLHRQRGEGGEYHGGAMYYIKDMLLSRGRAIAAKIFPLIFAFLCVVNSVTMGCVIQANAVSTAFDGVFSFEPWIVGAVIALACVFVISGDAKWVSAFSEKTVPVMTVGYIVLSLAVICLRFEAIPSAFSTIFSKAFDFSSAAGGIFGFLVSRQFKSGSMRGLMSNEAGCGTAPTAHASAETSSAAKQGFWGIFEVFVDTILLCTLTALVIILSGVVPSDFAADPMMMAIKAYSSVLGAWSEYYMAISVLLFAFATMVCWAHYGKESLRYITKKPCVQVIYVLLFCLFIFLGSISAPALAWLLADIAIGLMTLINLPVLLAMSGEVTGETESFFGG